MPINPSLLFSDVIAVMSNCPSVSAERVPSPYFHDSPSLRDFTSFCFEPFASGSKRWKLLCCATNERCGKNVAHGRNDSEHDLARDVRVGRTYVVVRLLELADEARYVTQQPLATLRQLHATTMSHKEGDAHTIRSSRLAGRSGHFYGSLR